MKRTHFSRAMAIVGGLALLATACGPSTPTGASPAPGATQTAAQVQKGGRVIEGSFSDIKTMNPMLVADVPSSTVTSRIYDDLIQADPKNGEPKPRMATFTQSQDGLTYTFTINDKAVWSDGKPVVAEDYLVAKKLVGKSKLTVRKSLFQDVEGFKDYSDGKATSISGITIDSANPKKFTVKLSKVSCDAIFQISSYTMPAHIFGKYATDTSKDEIDKAPENTNPPVASGPFKFKEWRQGDQVILTRNDTYWQGAPNVDEYVFKVVADATVLAAQLKTGELNLGTVEPKDLADIEAQEALRVTKYQQLGYTYIGWRTDSKSVPALGDKRVRQALAYGLNMDDVIKAVLFGQGVKQVAHHVPVQWAYPDPKSLNAYAYDQKKATELIEQAGYKKNAAGMYEKDGKTISFTIRTNAGNKTRETLAQVASEQYKKIGIDAKTNFEQFQGLVDKLTAGDPSIEAVIIGWSLGTSVDPYSIWHSSQIPDPATKTTGFGFTAFKSTELDNAIVQGRNPTNGDCSIATRKKHYETFNKLLNEEQPYNFGFSSITLAVTQKNMQNFDPGSFSTYYNMHEWWFKKS
jgi:peptide/nickel transport system substrate-binding protein